jgi:hypothetical protein
MISHDIHIPGIQRLPFIQQKVRTIGYNVMNRILLHAMNQKGWRRQIPPFT